MQGKRGLYWIFQLLERGRKRGGKRGIASTREKGGRKKGEGGKSVINLEGTLYQGDDHFQSRERKGANDFFSARRKGRRRSNSPSSARKVLLPRGGGKGTVTY